MRMIWIILAFALCLLVAPSLGATENVTAGSTVTMKGPFDILVSLHIEDFLPIAQARLYYNWISVFIIVLIGAFASSRTTRFFGILIPVVAALLVYFGWFTYNDPANPARLMGVIIIGIVLAAAIYMKGSLHERFGIAGPGSMMFNVVFFIIIMQATVGFVNSTDLWGGINAAPTGSDQYTNIDLQSEVTTISNTGGALNDLTQMTMILADMALGVLRMFIAMGMALIMFSVVLGVIYPWMVANPMGVSLLVILQLGIYIIYYMAFMRFVYKPVGEGDF